MNSAQSTNRLSASDSRGIEDTLGETDIDVEVALRIAYILEVMRLVSQVGDGVDLREIDAIKLVPSAELAICHIVALGIGDIQCETRVAFVDQIAAEICVYEPIGAGD